MITFVLAVCGNVDYIYTFPPSPPSRAAWIEIFSAVVNKGGRMSRRLHGRRGLKLYNAAYFRSDEESPPSRAAWIEMPAKRKTVTNA